MAYYITHRERFKGILEGRISDRTAWVPRLDIWYNATLIIFGRYDTNYRVKMFLVASGSTSILAIVCAVVLMTCQNTAQVQNVALGKPYKLTAADKPGIILGRSVFGGIPGLPRGTVFDPL